MGKAREVTRRRLLTTMGLLGVAAPLTALVPSAAAAGRTSAGARVAGEQRVARRMTDLTLESPALGGRAKVRLLTPDGWERRRAGERWPVLYLLHGITDDHQAWSRDTDVAEWPALRDVLVVMPDGGFAGFYSNWWNEGTAGPPAWETFHLYELRRLLEYGYGAGGARAVAGMSMGGFGAISYAARRPDLFRAAASFSGVVHPLHPRLLPMFTGFKDLTGVDLGPLWGDPVAQRHIWRAHDPYHLAHRLRGTPVYLSAGDGNPGPLDPPGQPGDPEDPEAMINEVNRATAARFHAAGIPLTTHFHTGTHHPAYGGRELRRSLPILLAALGVGARVR
ncbi:alpha/beta hydrolase [Streptomyces lycii]|uniref:Acyl-CoA:diacylglycerol acyltransferase n=1 Tax=Streptomyces lycii TaxID=2654337 RepID=A0ABQ7FGE6_9ACTN|nr:alpha/beta hydrolase family protein [Streptomyces lycii]KAF4407982.1 hypothetical protein GCU69_16540 [Streptomyces lycii]